MSVHTGGPAEPARAEARQGGANIVLNDAMFEGREVTQRHFARLLGEAGRAGAGRPESEVDRIVREAIDRSALPLPEVQIDRLVEQVVRGGGVSTITTDAGQVLFD